MESHKSETYFILNHDPLPKEKEKHSFKNKMRMKR